MMNHGVVRNKAINEMTLILEPLIFRFNTRSLIINWICI